MKHRFRKCLSLAPTLSFLCVDVDAVFDVSCKVPDEVDVVWRRADGEVANIDDLLEAAPQVVDVDSVERVERLQLDSGAPRQDPGHPDVVDPEHIVGFGRCVD